MNKLKLWPLLAFLLLASNCMKIESTGLSYGAFLEKDGIRFRVHAPKANKAFLVVFKQVEDKTGIDYPMESIKNGDWEITLNHIGPGTLYGYRLEGNAPGMDSNIIVADPAAEEISPISPQRTGRFLFYGSW